MPVSTVVPGGILPLLPHFDSNSFKILSNAEGTVRDLIMTHLLLLIRTEKSRVVSLLHDNKGNARLVATFEPHTSFSQCHQLIGQNMQELAFGNAIAIKYYPRGLEMCRLVELNEQLFDHGTQLGDNFLSVHLHANGCCISTRMSVH
jgi:hypothetical protein